VVLTTLHRSFAKAELEVPNATQGTFLPVGEYFTLHEAFGKILSHASKCVLLIDPFVDHTVLTRYGHLVPAGVELRLLASAREKKNAAGLVATIAEWHRQHGQERPVKLLLTEHKNLHDRIFLLDHGAAGWVFGQSIKDAVERSPTYLLKLPDEILPSKFAYYDDLWSLGKEPPSISEATV
jgi:hypothetical protein